MKALVDISRTFFTLLGLFVAGMWLFLGGFIVPLTFGDWYGNRGYGIGFAVWLFVTLLGVSVGGHLLERHDDPERWRSR